MLEESSIKGFFFNILAIFPNRNSPNPNSVLVNFINFKAKLNLSHKNNHLTVFFFKVIFMRRKEEQQRNSAKRTSITTD